MSGQEAVGWLKQFADKHGPVVVLAILFGLFVIHQNRERAGEDEAERTFYQSLIEDRADQTNELATSGHMAVNRLADSVAKMGDSMSELSKQLAVQSELLRQREEGR